MVIEKKKLPKVVVLMATYNGEKYLIEQVNSILNQKDVLVELLIRDDGSTDKTIDILNELQHKNNVKWYTGKNLGSARSFMDLMQNAPAADYYAFSDQDDYWYEDKLINGISNIIKIRKDIPALYYTSLEIVDEDLNYIGEHIIDDKRNNITGFIRSNVSGCVAIMNKNLLEKINKYEPDYIDMHDNWVYKVCVAIGGEIVVDKKTSIKHRQHGENARGLNNNLKNKIKKAYYFIFKYKLEPQMKNIKIGYHSEMLDEYKDMVNTILNYKGSLKLWWRLLTERKINFRNKFLNFLFKVKVLIRKV